MQLGDTIATYDLALALRDESGKFIVTSPAGEFYHVGCDANHSLTNMQWMGSGTNPQPFMIRKVAELVGASEKQGAGPAEPPAQIPIAKAPFLINPDTENPRSAGMVSQSTEPDSPLADSNIENMSGLDLLCAGSTPDSHQPTVWVCLKGEFEQNAGKLLTNPCSSFNEFDAEIRRLHSRLDDIRYRARKKFYEAHEIAPGA